MGYNRSGTRRTARLKRHKREMERLAAKQAASEPAPTGEAAKPQSAGGKK
ncbi:MAG TPA: hypothetical protein VFE78_14075 [Gemmataceae bacterium]|jgi:hypothetical protein|nr:hypothetical protein [Gemmataceae bacterium]